MEKLDESKPMLVGDLVQHNVDQSIAYRECAAKVDSWIKWEAGVIGNQK